MLAYVFWHRPAAGVAPETYAGLIARFQRSLAAHPPAGFVGSASFAAPPRARSTSQPNTWTMNK